MSLEKSTAAVHKKFGLWQQRIQSHFNHVIEQLRLLTGLVNEVILGLSRLVATFAVECYKLAKVLATLFFLVLPFVLLIALGIEIGGTWGTIMVITCLGLLVGLGLLIFLAGRAKEEEGEAKPRSSQMSKSKVVLVAWSLNLAVLAVYVAFLLFHVPQSWIMRPGYQVCADILHEVKGTREVDASILANHDFYTYLRVRAGETMRVRSDQPVRLSIAEGAGESGLGPSVVGDTLLVSRLDGVIILNGEGSLANVHLSVTKK